jgi:polysaccharide export outer membrane protein
MMGRKHVWTRGPMRATVLLCLLAGGLNCVAQTPRPGPAAPQVPAQERPQPVYVLSPGDQIVIRAANVEEMSEKPFRVDSEGFLNLPVVGRVKAAGLTVEQLEAELVSRLKTYIREPQVVVNVTETYSALRIAGQNPVFLLGPFKVSGVYVLVAQESLVEMLIRAGGLQPNASKRIKLTRRIDQGSVPLPNAVTEQDGKVTSVEITVNALMETVNPNENLPLKPFDVITATKIESVYVAGEVARSGAFGLEDRESLSITQLLAMTGGLGPQADVSKARVLRPVLSTARRAEIPIDLPRILAGRANDFPLLPNDVLYIPRRSGKIGPALKYVAIYTIPALATTAIYLGLRGY